MTNKPNDVRVSRELLEAWADRFSKAQMFKHSSEIRALLAQPADQQGEPSAWANGEQLLLCSRSRLDVWHSNPIYHGLPRNIAGSALKTEYCDTPLYLHAQPATAKVVLDDVFDESQWWFKELEAAVATGTPDQKRAVAVVRNLLGQIAKLNGIQS